LATGQTLVAAVGWFEWVEDFEDPKEKQPYYIRRKDSEPLWFTALAQMDRTGLTELDGDGFVIITANSDEGVVDIHDRRPVVLEADLAREWIEPNLPLERAEEIVGDLALPVEAFEWFAVDRAVGNVRNEGPELIAPIAPTPSQLITTPQPFEDPKRSADKARSEKHKRTNRNDQTQQNQSAVARGNT